MVLLKFITREVKSRPGRATLTLLSIVIAVAALVAVNVATDTTSYAYKEMYEKVTGRAALEVVAEGGGVYDDTVVATLEKTPGVKAAVPIFQQPTKLYRRTEDGQPAAELRMVLMGIDPAKDEAVRDYKLEEGQFFPDGEGALLEVGFARGLGVKVGQEIRIFTAMRPPIQTLNVVGLLSPQGAAGFNEGGIVFLPLDVAQDYFRKPGQVSSTSIILAEEADEKKVQAEIAGQLPAGMVVRPPAFRTQLAKETLQEAEQGLKLAYLLTLVLSVFMILNTFLMNVGERRRQLAILRAIGTTRRQLLAMMLGEGLLMGTVGTAIGIAVGLGGAFLLSAAMGKALSVSMPAMCITPWPFLYAALMGPGLSVLAMYIPARIASKITPLEGMRPAVAADSSRVPLTFTIVGGIVFVLSGGTLAACVLGFLPISFATVAGVIFTAAFVLLIPAALGPFTKAAAKVLHPLLRFEGHLARRQVLRRRARTTLTVGVLYIAVSSGIGLGTTIINNVDDVRKWHAQTIVGDFFLRVMFADQASNDAAPMPDSLGDELRAIPGVSSVDTMRLRPGVEAEGLSVTAIVRGFTGENPLPLDLKEGDPQEVRKRLFDGEAVAGSVFMHKAGKRIGDEIALKSPTGEKRVRIAGITTEYIAGGMILQMERAAGKRLLDVDGVGVYMLTAKPQDRAAVESRLKTLADEQGLMLHSLAQLRDRLDGIMNGVIASLWGLLALGFVVAAFGIANTLTMNVLEQTRELAMLRVVAMTRAQVRKAVLSQAAIIGAIGLTAGIIGGMIGSYLTNACMMAVLGHSVEFALHPELLAICFAAGIAIVLMAALFPAERAARLNLLIALQYE